MFNEISTNVSRWYNGEGGKTFQEMMSTKLGIDTQKSGAGKLFYTKQKFNLKWIKNLTLISKFTHSCKKAVKSSWLTIFNDYIMIMKT
jgi:hypothetical protein